MKHHEPHEPRIAKSEGHKTTNYNQQMSGDAPFENYWLVCCIPRRAIPICDDILISHLIRTPPGFRVDIRSPIFSWMPTRRKYRNEGWCPHLIIVDYCPTRYRSLHSNIWHLYILKVDEVDICRFYYYLASIFIFTVLFNFRMTMHITY
jgi:hypothetical protein